ncbi:MAG: STAS domain-containing protein [Bacteroidales bacterium]|nr:STAS domain-containing protein [Bacteroidales bacterium]HNW72953.1 STAS domain-containing protein [Bacteroidales bacterium]HPS50546.1 STAS domain-containing protein [Bacteroidales bacterium]
MLTIQHQPENDLLVFLFSGRLDTVASGPIAEEIGRKIDKIREEAGNIPYRIVFDLNEVDYISSSFIRICVNTAKQSQLKGFSIIHCKPFLKSTFKISGLDEILNVS